MELVTRLSPKDEFQRRSAISRDLQQRLAEQARKRDEDREEELRDEAEMIELVQSVLLASETQIAEFTVELDCYDSATIQALINNGEQLAAVQARIDGMLVQAHVLPDGRRLFKTQDGSRVFDEHGTEIEPTIIQPAEIEGGKPTWESFEEVTAERARLSNEREGLIEYQEKLDTARERLDAPNLSEDELKALDAALANEMPDSVRQVLDLPAKPAEPATKDELSAFASAADGPSTPVAGTHHYEPL
jgi:hypothetical protein